MRPILAVSAGATLLLIASGAGWAGERSRTKSTESAADTAKDKETPASFNKTFQWEEKVVGPKTKGVDHEKIAAMQERGRRDDAAKKQQPPKKAERAAGVNGPASSVIPTQDIEKPHAVALRKASYTPPPKQHDEIDNVLAENGVGASSDGGRDGFNKVFGGSSKHRGAKHAKRARRR